MLGHGPGKRMPLTWRGSSWGKAIINVTNMEKNLLFITYVFPPVGGAGIQRNIKFIKYLTLNNWDVTVLAPANPSVPVVDNSFIDDIPTRIEVVRTKTL